MIFWILLALIVFVAIMFIREYDLFLGVFVTPILGGLIMLLAIGIPALCLPASHYKEVGNETVNLRSMGSGDGISGRSYFLGGGYIESKKVLNYIRSEADGASRLRAAPAELSKIYEVNEKPTLITRSYEKRVWWLAPFKVGSVDNYEFRVPNGTVSGDFTVSTGKESHGKSD